MLAKLTLFLAFMIISSWLLCTEVDQAILDTAQDHLLEFLYKIPFNELANFNINTHEDLAEVKLATPYNLLNISPNAEHQTGSFTDISAISSPTSIWFFPLVHKSKYIGLIIVDKINGNWKIVSFGYWTLANQLKQVEEIWTGGCNTDIKLLSDGSLQNFYFSVTDNNITDNLTKFDLKKSNSNDSDKYSKLSSWSKTIKEIKLLNNSGGSSK